MARRINRHHPQWDSIKEWLYDAIASREHGVTLADLMAAVAANATRYGTPDYDGRIDAFRTLREAERDYGLQRALDGLKRSGHCWVDYEADPERRLHVDPEADRSRIRRAKADGDYADMMRRSAPATARQLRYLAILANRAGLDAPPDVQTVAQAAEAIEALKAGTEPAR